MKKKIILGISIFSLFFLAGGIYIITAIEKTTSTLDNLIKLHQVEILREHLLIQIKRVQSDLHLKGSRYARGIDTIVNDVRNMETVADVCFDCHHSPEITEKLDDVKNHMEKYKDTLSRVFTIRANESRLVAEEDVAFKMGESLKEKLNSMILLTNKKLNEKTRIGLREIARTKTILFILVSIGPIFAIALAYFFIRSFTKPVSAILNATRRLKGGDLDYRIEALKDEFGEVATSFNEMAGSLKEQMYKMQRAEQMTVVGQMATGLAHEIKNPLAGIKASMEVLSEELTLSDEDRAVLVRVIEEVRGIESLMKSLLNFAKPPTPQLMTADINNILNKTVDFSLQYPALSSKDPNKINIIKDLDNSLPETMADPMQLQQVFLNLFLNASEAMTNGGALTVKTSHDGQTNSIKIEISDTGKGIEQEMMEKIFQPFFTTKSKGTGLGLSITKQLVEQHGGTISLSTNPGEGTTFEIILPIN
jgi:signal transduction histidine kinase